MTIIKNQKFILILFLISLTFLVGNVFAEGTVNFNVYQDSGRDYNLTGITVDCNGTDYDLTNQTSPFSINFTTTGPHTCIFSKSEWDGNTINITADTNKTMNVYLDKFIYPKIYAFYATTATTSSTTPVAVQTWSYNANFGGTTSASVACVLWASSGATTFTGTWNIDSSDDGITWTTRGTTTRSMESNTVAANPFIESPSYNISDGTRYLRLTHSSSSASGVLTTNNVSCHLRTNRDQNNFLITTTSNSVPQTNINSTVYANLGTPFTLTAPFNGLLYTVGSTIYNKANGFTSSETAIRALKNTIAYAEYPRYVTSNTSGTGGLAELLKDINSAQTITIQYQGKSTTSQARFTITANNYFLNQKVGEFEQTLLTGKTNNTRDWNKIACATFTKDVNRNIELVSVIPFRSSATTDLFEIYINLNGTGYDANSSIMKRNTTAANQNVIIKHQYFFRDVNTTTVEGCIYGRSTTGTITITGGNIFGITANTIWPTPVLDLNSPIIISDLNLFQQGYPNSNADLTSHSDVDVYFDFNAQGNAIDVNSAKLYYRPPYDDQNCFGVERTTKQCGWKQEASSSFFTGLLLSYFVQ